MLNNEQPVALVTGSAKRLGRKMIETLHHAGYRVIIHCNNSVAAAEALALQLNQQRANSAKVVTANLIDPVQISLLAEQSLACFERIDVLVNNASSFYPTPIANATEEHWQDLLGSNVKAPYFLSQALVPELTRRHGSIVNMVDIHADKPLQDHSIYCMAKAALKMMTKSLARELAPTIRVNGIAPGAILWPSDNAPELAEQDKAAILQQVPLNRLGDPADIAQTLLFLIQAPYITGQIIAVDGGRSLGGANKA